MTISVTDTDPNLPTALNLDFDGMAKVAEVRHNGKRVYGDISHETYSDWVMGRGRLRAETAAFIITVR